MSIVDRYLARTFLSGYLILVVVGIGLYVMSDLLVNIDEFTKDRTADSAEIWANIGNYYGWNLPLYYSQLGGPMITIAAAFTFAMMVRNNELTALIASGMPLQRLLVPVAACSVFLTGLWIVNQEVVLPGVAHLVVRDRDNVRGEQTVGTATARDENNNIVTALEVHPGSRRLRRVYIIEPDAAGNPANLISADEAIYDPQRRIWELVRGRRARVNEMLAAAGIEGPEVYEPVDEYPLRLTPEQIILRQKSEWATLLSLRQMGELIASSNLPNRPTLVMARHVRLTQPLLQLLFLLVVVPFLLVREPVSVLAAGGRALVAGALFFGLAFICHSIVADESAALVAWTPILVFGPFAAWRLSEVHT